MNEVVITRYRVDISDVKTKIFEFINVLEKKVKDFGIDKVEKVHFSKTGNTERAKTVVWVNDKIRFRTKKDGVVEVSEKVGNKWQKLDVMEDEELYEWLSEFDKLPVRSKNAGKALVKSSKGKSYLESTEAFLKYMEEMSKNEADEERIIDIVDEAYSEGLIENYDIKKDEEGFVVEISLWGEKKEFSFSY